MAVTRSTTSRASSVSELRRSIGEYSDDDSGSDFTDSGIDSDGSDTDDDDLPGSDVLASASKPPSSGTRVLSSALAPSAMSSSA